MIRMSSTERSLFLGGLWLEKMSFKRHALSLCKPLGQALSIFF